MNCSWVLPEPTSRLGTRLRLHSSQTSSPCATVGRLADSAPKGMARKARLGIVVGQNRARADDVLSDASSAETPVFMISFLCATLALLKRAFASLIFFLTSCSAAADSRAVASRPCIFSAHAQSAHAPPSASCRILSRPLRAPALSLAQIFPLPPRAPHMAASTSSFASARRCAFSFCSDLTSSSASQRTFLISS